MESSIYVVLDKKEGISRAVKGKPTQLKNNQIVIKLNLTIPDGIFRDEIPEINMAIDPTMFLPGSMSVAEGGSRRELIREKTPETLQEELDELAEEPPTPIRKRRGRTG